VVGSYATARKDIPAALAGVATAAALVPPICTFGLQLAFGNTAWALGAMLLFLTNMDSIIVISAVVFRWLGLRPHNLTSRSRRPYYSLVIFTVLALPTVLALLMVIQQAGEDTNIERELRRVLQPLSVVEVMTNDADPAMVTAVVRSPYALSPEVAALAERELLETLGIPVQVALVVQPVVLSPQAEAAARAQYVGTTFTVTDNVLIPVGINGNE